MDTAEKSNYSFALLTSVVGHIAVAILMLVNFGANSTVSSGIVYSVTLEGGKQLGGLSQVAKTTKDTQVAPPKNVSSTSEETKPDTKDVEEKVHPDEADAEVSLAEKKKEEEEKKRLEEEKRRKDEEKKKAEDLKKKKEEEQKKKAEDEKKKKEEAKKKASAQPADVSKDYQKALQRYLGESTEAGGKGFGAGKIGGNGMGGGVLMPPEFFTYRQILRNKVKSGWNWFNTNAALTTWVVFSVGRDGTISDVSVAESSGNREYDESVLRALYKASPLPPPPATVYEHFKSVKMSFDPRD